MKVHYDGAVDVKNRAILDHEGVRSVRFPRLARASEVIGLSIISRGRFSPTESITVPDDEFRYDPEAVERLRVARGIGGAVLVLASVIPLSLTGDVAEYALETVESIVHSHVTEPLSKLSYMKF